MRIFFLGLACLCLSLMQAKEPIPYFTPPSDWMVTDPQFLTGTVKIGFLSKGKKGFCPSLNLAVEKGCTSQKEYLQTLKAIYESNPLNRYRELGTLSTLAGEAALIEIDVDNTLGKVRLLQMLFVKEKVAYILTASALKEEFGQYYKTFKKAFSSFTIRDDLLDSIADHNQRALLKTRLSEVKSALSTNISQKEKESKYLLPFQTHLAKNHEDLGLYWQLLVLQSACEKN